MNLEMLVEIVDEAFKTLRVVLAQDDAESDLLLTVDCVRDDLLDVITGKLTPQPQ